MDNANIDFDELFTGIWSAVEYGNNRKQYEEQITALCEKAFDDGFRKGRREEQRKNEHTPYSGDWKNQPDGR